MNTEQIVAWMEKSDPSALRACFVDGASSTDCVIVSANPHEIRAQLPAHVVFGLGDIARVPVGRLIVLDPSAVLSLVLQLVGKAPEIRTDRRSTGNYRVFNSQGGEVRTSGSNPLPSPDVIRKAYGLNDPITTSGAKRSEAEKGKVNEKAIPTDAPPIATIKSTPSPDGIRTLGDIEIPMT